MPDMTTRGWVETNGHYGYGCACMTVSTDRRDHADHPDPFRRRRCRCASAAPTGACRAPSVRFAQPLSAPQDGRGAASHFMIGIF